MVGIAGTPGSRDDGQRPAAGEPNEAGRRSWLSIMSVPPSSAGAGNGGSDATRRTHLAAERTFLAWSRTALAAFGVGIAIGKVVPELANRSLQQWPYVTAGIGYAGLGVFIVIAGWLRQNELDERLAGGGFRRLRPWLVAVISIYTVALGIFTVALVLLPFH
jgi:putative membrane protein